MSNRLSGGQRVNQWGRCGGHESGGSRGAAGKRQRKSRPSHEPAVSQEERAASSAPGLFGEVPAPRDPRRCGTSRRPNGKRREEESYYADGGNPLPAIANPGSVVRESYDAEQVRQLLARFVSREVEEGDVIRALVGGGVMGSALAHSNEAPMSLTLAAFFVRSYCPPGGVVLDPFCGSGTSLEAAVYHGRRAVGIDVRPCQVELSRKRVSGVTPPLPLFDRARVQPSGQNGDADGEQSDPVRDVTNMVPADVSATNAPPAEARRKKR
jgi:hypothetical protein